MTAKKERKKEKRKGTPGDQTSPLRDDGLCDKSAAKHDFIQRNALYVVQQIPGRGFGGPITGKDHCCT